MKRYRLHTLKAVCMGNLPLSSLDEIRDYLDTYTKTGLTVGDPRDILRVFSEPLLEEIRGEIRLILKASFPQFGISINGTPSFAEDECDIVRFVTHDYKIVELTVKLSLFKEKLTSFQITSHILSTIKDIFRGLAAGAFR